MRRIPPGVRLGGLLVVLLCAFAIVWFSGSASAERVRDWVDGYGAAGPLVFIVVGGVLGSVFFPGPVLAAASGLLFGIALGTPVAIASALLTATIGFVVARFVAGDAIERLAGPRLTGIVQFIEHRPFLSVLYVRLLPGVPYNLFNYGVGLTRVPIAPFLLATLIGTSPRTWAYVALGGSFGDFHDATTIIALGIIVGMGVAGVIVFWLQWTGRLRLPGSAGARSSRGARSEDRR
jgi:uncharacterized membrane protein YdjX (TVP38/TMEM64 family)